MAWPAIIRPYEDQGFDFWPLIRAHVSLPYEPSYQVMPSK